MKYLIITILFLSSLFFAQDVSASVIMRPMHHFGLVGYWDFQLGKGGTTAYDRSGNGNHGTLTAMDPATDWVDSKSGLGQALDFDGVNDYVDVGTTQIISARNPFTMSAWVYVNTSPGTNDMHNLYAHRLSDLDGSFQWSVGEWAANNTKIDFETNSGGSWTSFVSNTAISLNQWYHLAIMYNGTDINFYIDGVLDASTAYTQPGTTERAQTIGRAGGSDSFYFDGKIDEVRIYNRALSAEEVERLYKITKPKIATVPMSDGLVGYWDFQLGKGGTTAYDMSGNGNHGTLTAMDPATDWVDSKSGLGQALDFDGADDYVNLTPIISNIGTYSVWVKPNFSLNPSSRYTILGDTSGGNVLRFDVSTYGGFDNYHFEYRGGYGSTCELTVNPDLTTDNSLQQWTHVVVIWDTSSASQFFINGVGRDSINCTTGTLSLNGLNIGANDNSSSFWNGLIDEVRIYNRALSAGEVERLYKITKPIVNASTVNKLSEGLVGHWTFDGPDMSNDIAYDQSGQGNDGTLTGGPVRAIGRLGQALDFDGANDYVDVGNPVALQITGSMTISAWGYANTVSGADKRFIGKNGANGNKGYVLTITTDNASPEFLIFASPDGTANAGRYSITQPTINTWYHIVGVVDTSAQIIDIYVNGKLDNGISLGTASAIKNSSISFTIGTGNNNLFDGLIDEVRIYNRALSAEEIKRLYNMGR